MIEGNAQVESGVLVPPAGGDDSSCPEREQSKSPIQGRQPPLGGRDRGARLRWVPGAPRDHFAQLVEGDPHARDELNTPQLLLRHLPARWSPHGSSGRRPGGTKQTLERSERRTTPALQA
jgi:hypothetical protein